MSEPQLTAVLFAVFAGLLALGVPVAFALGLAAFAWALAAGVPMLIVAQKIAAQMGDPTLLAIPFFILAGEIMTAGTMARRLVDLANVTVGFLRGGLAMVNVVASMFFGGISGSSVADTSSIGSILVPMMTSRGYDRGFSVAVTVASSTQGIVVPPSHNAILYALAAGGTVSIGALFLAGYAPGLLIAGALVVLSAVVARRRGFPREERVPAGEAVRIAVGALPALVTPLIIIVPISAGWIPAQQAAILAVVWSAAVSHVVYRSLRLRAWPGILQRAARTSSMVLILIGCAAAFGEALVWLHVPARIAAALTELAPGPVTLLLGLDVALLALGMVMDMAPLIVILTPILLPATTAAGVDPVHFGIVMLLALSLGLLTPPVGSTLFVGCAVGGIRIEEAVRALLPFYAVLAGVLLVVTLFPDLVLALPRWVESR